LSTDTKSNAFHVLRDTLRNRADKTIDFACGRDTLAQHGIEAQVFYEMLDDYEELGILCVDPQKTIIQLAE